MDDVKEKDEALKSNPCPKEDVPQIVVTPETVSTISKDEGNTTVGPQIDEGHDKEKGLTEGEAHEVQAVLEAAVEGKNKEKTEEQINGENSGGGLKRKGLRPRRRNVKKKVAQKASEMVVRNGNEGNVVATAYNGFSIDEERDKEKALGEEETPEDVVKGAVMKGEGEEKTEEKKTPDKLGESSNGKGRKLRRIRWRKSAQESSEMVVGTGNERNAMLATSNGLTIDEERDKEKDFVIMDDVKVNDEALKSNSYPKEDVPPQIVVTLANVSTTSKDEGNTTVGLQINERHGKEKGLTEGEAHKVQAVVEITVEEKSKEKTEEQINGENSGGALKRKGLKARRRNVKKKVAQKASEMVVRNGTEGNVVAAANNGFSIDEEHDREKALGEEETPEDAVKGTVMKGEGKEKIEEKKNTDKLGKSSNGVGRKRRRIRRRKSAQKASEMVVGTGNEGYAMVAASNGLTIDEERDKEKASGEEETAKDAMKETLIKVETEEKKNIDKLGECSNGKGRKPRRNRQKKIAQKGTEMVDVDGDKPESSSKKSASKKVESMGMVFMCSSKTKADCFRYKIFGLPAGKKDQVEKIYKGMRLFLFDVDLRLMYGIFKAAGEGGYNIEPKAFKSASPSQVRFTVIEDCLPLAEEKFRNVIKKNYYTRNKFECQLNAQQVKKLCKLFVPAKSGPIPKKSVKDHLSGDGERHRGRDAHQSQAWEEERQPHPRLGREQRRYHDYGYGQPPIRYEREAHPSPVHPVARYLPPLSYDPAPVRSFGRDTTYSYGRDPLLDHRSYRALDTKPRHYDEIVSREHDRYHLYGREPPIYRDNVHPSVEQTVQYHHLQAASLPPQYRLVSREYPPPAVEPTDYHISGGLQARGYHDVDHVSEYLPSAASIPEYRPLQTHYGY